jgi:PAS domain S-box-containing protein
MAGFPSYGTSMVTELAGRRKDGTELTADVSFVEITRDGRRNFTGFARDISERKRTEEALRANERDLGLIVESIPALVWVAAPDGELTYVNQRVRDYTGTSLDALAQAGWNNFLHPDDVEPRMRAWTDAVAMGQPYEVQYRLASTGGSKFSLSRCVTVKAM